jgi:hypothetical protein
VPEHVLRRGLIASAMIGLVLVPGPAAGVPAGDLERIGAQITSMLDSPRGQIREWSGPTGNRGQIRLGPAVDTVVGETCTSWEDCSEPCRNADYSLVGQDESGRTVDNNYRAYYCLRSGAWTTAQGFKATSQRVLAERPESRPVIARHSSPPVVAPAPIPTAAPSASPVHPDLVRSLQARLKGLLYYAGAESGRLDEPTVAALREFLLDEGLAVGDVRIMGMSDLVFIDSRLRDAHERGRTGNCTQPGRFVACGAAG